MSDEKVCPQCGHCPTCGRKNDGEPAQFKRGFDPSKSPPSWLPAAIPRTTTGGQSWVPYGTGFQLVYHDDGVSYGDS